LRLGFSVSEGRVYLPGRRVLQTELEDLQISSDGKKMGHPEKRSDGNPGSKGIVLRGPTEYFEQ